MEIRNGMRMFCGTNEYAISQADDNKGMVGNICFWDKSTFERELSEKNTSYKLTYYPYKVGDWAIAKCTTDCEYLIQISTVSPISSSRWRIFDKKEENLWHTIGGFNTLIRPAFSWEIPKEEIKETELTPEVNPMYVECIEEKPGFYGKLGMIYEVETWNHSDSDCYLKGTTSLSTSKKRFKPSTKEAYDAQFNKSIEKVIIDTNNLEMKDLIDGEIYYWKLDRDEYIDRYLNKGDGIYRASCYISIREGEFKCFPNDAITFKNLRVATQEEKDWLQACEKTGKYISKENALKSNDKLNKKEENMNDLDKMIAEKENYINITSSGPLKSTTDNKLSPASEMRTTIGGLKPRSKKVCYTSTVIKIAM